MAPSEKECCQTFGSDYQKSSLNLLYGGMRNRLFVEPHPLGGLSAVNVGLKVGKGFYDLQEQQLEYKDSGWRVKMKFGDANLFNLKRKVGAKTPGQSRNHIQFGTDESHFGSDNQKSKFSVGGMYTLGLGGILTTTRFKIFTDQSAEMFMDTTVAGVKLAGDLRIDAAEGQAGYKGFLGASLGLPSLPGLNNAHIGAVVALDPTKYPFGGRPSVGLFAEAPVAVLEKAVVGVELFNGPNAVLLGAELTVDKETSIIAKAGDNGIAQISILKKFKGLDLRMGVEADCNRSASLETKGIFGKFGAEVTLKQ